MSHRDLLEMNLGPLVRSVNCYMCKCPGSLFAQRASTLHTLPSEQTVKQRGRPEAKRPAQLHTIQSKCPPPSCSVGCSCRFQSQQTELWELCCASQSIAQRSLAKPVVFLCNGDSSIEKPSTRPLHNIPWLL